MYECLNNTIGITRSDCSCVVSGLTDADLTGEWYKLSTSDLYIDELEGIVSIQAIGDNTDCVNEMAKWYYQARANATKMFADELIAGLSLKYRTKNKNYLGNVGNTSFPGTSLNILSGYAGVMYSTAPMVGGYMTLSSVTAMMNQNATFDIQIIKVQDGADEYEVVDAIEGVSSVANSKSTSDITPAIKLPFSEFGTDYFLVYQPSGFQPKANAVSCGCGNGNASILKNYVNVYGVQGNNLSTINMWSRSSYANGLSFYADIGCDTSEAVCQLYSNGSPGARAAIPYAIRYKAGELVHEYILKSGNINRYTMVKGEFLLGKRNHFRAEYNTRLQWLIQNADVNLVGCYVCNNKQVRKSGILV